MKKEKEIIELPLLVDEFIYWYYDDLDRQECYAIAKMMVNALINEGEFSVKVKELFDVCEYFPFFVVDFSGYEDIEEEFENEFDGEFEGDSIEYKDKIYKIVLN